MTDFLESFGFEVLNSEKTSFGVTPKMHSTQACLDQVELADYFILIIGSRRGSDFLESEQSITNAEFGRAKELGLVIVPFVKSDVLTARMLFRKNPTGDFSDVVDDNRIFAFIDSIDSSAEDNWLHTFNSVSDIKESLRSQFSHYLLLYAKYLGRIGGKAFKPTTMNMIVNGMAAVCQVLATDPEIISASPRPK